MKRDPRSRDRATPLLVVVRIEARPARSEQVTAKLLLGGRPERMGLDLSAPNLIGFAKMPEALDHHLSANKAVIDVMVRRHGGEDVVLPVDLSDVVRQGNEPWPLRIPDAATRAANESASAAVPVAVRHVEHDPTDPRLTTIELDFDGTPTVVIVDRRDGPERSVRFRFVRGVHPWQLTPVEHQALLVATGAVPPCPPGEDSGVAQEKAS